VSMKARAAKPAAKKTTLKIAAAKR
jgi:hypothetical protein